MGVTDTLVSPTKATLPSSGVDNNVENAVSKLDLIYIEECSCLSGDNTNFVLDDEWVNP